jgi:circadian clock protein KaiB
MADVNEYRLKLYVTGGTTAADRAVSALKRLGRIVTDRVHSEIVDVLLHPELTLDMNDEPLPVLVRLEPQPVRVFQGSITEPEQIARVLTED